MAFYRLNNLLGSISHKIFILFPEAVKSGEGVDFSGDSVTENGSVIISHDVSDEYKTEETSNVITTTAEISPQQPQPIGEYKSDEKAMNRNWSNQKANPALKTQMGNN